jgi:hypothetical protein
MTRKQAEDIRWVAAEVADLAVLLRSHGLGHLANRLNSVHQALQYAPQGHARVRREEGASCKIISLDSFRQRLR